MAAAFASNLIGRRCRNIVVLALCLVAHSSFDLAMADTVNGEWCSLDGRRLEISYENVRLNEEYDMKGDYDRHHYVFRIPPLNQDEETTFDIVLARQDVVIVRYLSDSGLEVSHAPHR